MRAEVLRDILYALAQFRCSISDVYCFIMITYSSAKLIHLYDVPTDVQKFQQLHLRLNLYTICEHRECITKYLLAFSA